MPLRALLLSKCERISEIVHYECAKAPFRQHVNFKNRAKKILAKTTWTETITKEKKVHNIYLALFSRYP